MSDYYDDRSEYITGEQSLKTRIKRGRNRNPNWKEVEMWRARWTPNLVLTVFNALKNHEDLTKIDGLHFIKEEVDGKVKVVPDLRGIDITLVSDIESNDISIKNYDFSYYHFEGSILTRIYFKDVKLYKANFQKATLRDTNFHNCRLVKTHVEDSDLRGCKFDDSDLAFIWYTEDSWLIPGTILRNTIFRNTINVDPILERYIKDQSFLYVFKYRSKFNDLIYRLWWLTSNCGRSIMLWFVWSDILVLLFGILYMPAPKFLGNNFVEFWNKYGPSLHLDSHTPTHWFTYFYYSIVTFTTLGFGDVTPQNLQAEILVTLEVIIGYIMLGGLISIFANKMVRRI